MTGFYLETPLDTGDDVEYYFEQSKDGGSTWHNIYPADLAIAPQWDEHRKVYNPTTGYLQTASYIGDSAAGLGHWTADYDLLWRTVFKVNTLAALTYVWAIPLGMSDQVPIYKWAPITFPQGG
jgi:hypothetical protein